MATSCNNPSEESGAGKAAQPPAALSDAPVSNRASSSCDVEGIQVLSRGFDFLELSIRGELDPEKAKELVALKSLAQSDDGIEQAAARIQIGDQSYIVQDRGARLFPFILDNKSRFYLKVKSRRAKALPLVFAQVRSEYLSQIGIEAVAKEAVGLANVLGTVDGEPTVSRVDLTVDFVTAADMEGWDRRAWVTRAQDKKSYSQGDRFSGWSIGYGGDLACRLYDKTLEIETRSRKSYLHEDWKEAGWFPGDVVWRLEFQVRRTALAERGLTTVEDVLRGRPSLWRYLTQDWLRLTVPSPTDETRGRWPTHPVWEALSAVAWPGEEQPLVRRSGTSNAPSDRMIARFGTSVLTSVMAKNGLATVDEAVDALMAICRREWQERESWEGASAEQLLLDKALKKSRLYGVHLLPQALGITGRGFGSEAPSRVPGEEG